MPIYNGNIKQKELYYGGTKIKEAYYGGTKVYSSGPLPLYYCYKYSEYEYYYFTSVPVTGTTQTVYGDANSIFGRATSASNMIPIINANIISGSDSSVVLNFGGGNVTANRDTTGDLYM